MTNDFHNKPIAKVFWLAVVLMLQACQSLTDNPDCGRDCWYPNSNTSSSHHLPGSSGSQSDAKAASAYFCKEPQRFSGKVIGDGHCVSLIRACSQASFTKDWRPGPYVMQSQPKPGSIIATFRDGRYPSRTGYHAAIYISHSDEGIWVWDQWRGTPVHKRLIRFRKQAALPSNTAQAYRLVLPVENN